MRMFQKMFFIMTMIIFILTGCGKNIEQQVVEQLELGNRYLAEMDYEQAIVAFNKVIELDPKNVEAYIYLSEAYMEMGMFDDAVEQLELGYEQTGNERIWKILQEYRISLSENDLKMFQELYQMMEAEDYASAISSLGQYREELIDIFKNQMSGKLYLFDGTYVDKNLNKKGIVSYIKERESGDGYHYVDYYLFYGEFIDAKPNGKVSYVIVICNGEGEIQGEEYFIGEWKDGYLNGPGHWEFGQLPLVGGQYSFMHIYDGNFVNDVLTGDGTDVDIDIDGEKHVFRYKIEDGYESAEGTIFDEEYRDYFVPCELCDNVRRNAEFDYEVFSNPWKKYISEE